MHLRNKKYKITVKSSILSAKRIYSTIISPHCRSINYVKKFRVNIKVCSLDPELKSQDPDNTVNTKTGITRFINLV